MCKGLHIKGLHRQKKFAAAHLIICGLKGVCVNPKLIYEYKPGVSKIYL